MGAMCIVGILGMVSVVERWLNGDKTITKQ